MTSATIDTDARRHWMGVLAKSSPARLAQLWTDLDGLPGWSHLRRPEVGLVMVRGRMGGDGGPFNMGEMTVTRCSVRVDGGAVGHAWVAGRSSTHAEMAALADALLQMPGWHQVVADAVVAPLARQLAEDRARAGRQAAATRVDFFTMVRGED
ncbi:phosphonate C-P lyase system protein PhnG [Magnetospirillum sp. 64-120]|uniref:phosphonate C-P lyase system protein PhnG n=1 Tax=Magnetospirillum sp. 64-120 TaxID=1895778 RepID=UPI000928078B|nr:phosphonate C-P lyase system protein PhnG [Magnetospirillum sp. 64-120]OJX80010.1 MAG: phosphonate C-P lyase system protein PhnG [Magnetospirillum sp. 64-120]